MPRSRSRTAALVAALALVAASASTFTPPAAQAAPAERTVTGQVRDAVTGAPVAGAVVHAAAQTTSVRTGADGRFSLPRVPADTIGVVAAKQGYDFRWQPLESRGDTAVTLRLDRDTPRSLPHPDYPRPDLDRRAGADGKWLNLNGTWSLSFDPRDVGRTENWAAGGHEWQHAVRVPFSYTSLAGVGEQARANNQVYASQFEANRGAVWYQRQVTVPADWPAERNVLLRFGAVEWNAVVFLNGVQRAEHDGGYSPFEVDLGRLAPGSTHSLVVRAFAPDNSDRTPYPQGKQMGWYADTGGIWQSVWLEPADPARLDTVHVTPKLTFAGDRLTSAKAEVAITGNTAAAGSTAKITIREQAGRPGVEQRGLDLPKPVEPKAGRVIATSTLTLDGTTGKSTVDIPEARLWSPNTPWLYQVQVELTGAQGRDALHTWTGLRTISRDWAPGHSPAEQSDPQQQYQYLHLNNKPIYLRSALDQAFNPWGTYSYTGLYQGGDLRAGSVGDPRKGSVLFDLALAKQLGLNSTRLHIKINDPLYYHWADVMGLMVWYDQPNFGYNGYQARAEQLFESVLHDAVKRDYNHPSIVIWDVFNEGWGITDGNGMREDAKPWVERMVQLTKQLTQGGRLIVDNSPCCNNHHPSESTDLLDFHGYLSTWEEWKSNVDHIVRNTYPGSTFNMEEGKKQAGQPLLNSEFGPWSGGREKDQDVAAPFRYTTELFRNQPKMNGYLFTELADIEWEWNGWSAYDRTLQVPGYLDADGKQGGVHLANADDVLFFDARPVQRVTPGQPVSLTAKSSLFSGRDLGATELRWRISGTDATGAPVRGTEWARKPVSPKKYTTSDLGKVEVTVPAELTHGRLDIQLVRGRDVLATGQTFLADWSTRTDRATVLGEQRTSPSRVAGTIRLDPAAAKANWPQGHDTFRNDGSSAAWGYGDGEFQWTVELPDELREGRWNTAQLVLEASASRPGSPRTRFPQTSERRYPTTFRAFVDGVSTQAVVLPDDPADARGALSNESGFDPGQYGYRVVLDLDARKLKEAAADGRFTLSLTGSGGGLTVHGPRTGRFGISPQLVLSQGRGVSGPPVQQPESYVGTTEGAGVNTHFVPGTLKEGQATPASVLVVNDSPRTVRQVRPELVLPAGWLAEPVGEVSTVDLRPGESTVARYRLVPGSVGDSQVTTRAFYRDDAGRQVVDEPWLVTVPVPEPTEANYPKRTILDGFDSDTSAHYRGHQPFSGEAAPAPTVSDSKLKVSHPSQFFTMIGSNATPSANPAVNIVEVGELAGGSMRENSLFTGLVKDKDTYVVAWYNHFRKQTGFDIRLNGQFLQGNPTARLDLQPGDKFALVVAGKSLDIFHGRDGRWTSVRTGSVDPRLNLSDPTVLSQFRHGVAMRGDSGTVSIESLEGRTR
ncbi:sugar-binding domain-containing protein [Crossiella sp. CA198]|uniref:sugar-binding domain-containing protein n=1 Tax=Crossiella sp. CA198 TaxID=3455607 RepID=UPI003F8D53AB